MCNTESYIGFYTHTPFWAISDVFQHFSENDSEKQFTLLMEEIVLEHETNEYTLKVCRDGMFLFKLTQYDHQNTDDILPVNIEKSFEKASEYLRYVNTILLLFESSFLEIEKITLFDGLESTIKDVFDVRFNNGKWVGSGVPTLSLSSYFQTARYPLTYSSNIPITFDSRLHNRFRVSQSVFQKLFCELDVVFQKSGMVKTLAKLSKSLSEFKIANYDTSFIISWFIIEFFINSKWNEWLQSKQTEFDNGIKRINSDRQKNFEGRDYTISTILNILELSDILTFDMFEQINKLRILRNKIVHSDEKNKVCGGQECCTALIVAANLIEEKLGFKINLNLGYSISGTWL